MSEFIRVDSIEMLKEFRVALCTFAHTASVALGEAHSEIQRTILWLKQDQYAYWKTQVRLRSERFEKAKLELKRKKIEKSSMGMRYSFVDEKKALVAAQRDFEQAQQKFDKVRYWIGQFEKEAHTVKGLVQGLTSVVEIEIPNARAQMDRMVDSLEAYTALTPTAGIPTDIAEQVEEISLRVEPPIAHSKISYQKLRKKTPPITIRNQTQVGNLTCGWFTGIQLSASASKAITGISVESRTVSPNDKVLIAKAVSEHRRFYLERIGPSSRGDSGWYIGIIDARGTHDYEGIRVADLLDLRPDLSEILNVPVGYLVVLDGDSIEAVVDPNNQFVQLDNG